jgi:hypothetical protein
LEPEEVVVFDTSSLALVLLQIGLLSAAMIGARILAGRRAAVDAVPGIYRHRVEQVGRLCPSLLAAALVLTLAGAILLVA